ncbi:MAG: hypothetical protein ACREN3_04130 [Gemmatimonadaceae bacterium]
MGVTASAPRSWANTLRTLILRPGAITRAALDGQGGGYLPLGRLLVVLAAVYFLITLAQQDLQRPPDPAAAAACANGRVKSELDLLLGAVGAPEAVGADSAAAGLEHVIGAVLCDPQRLTSAFSLAVPIAFLLLLPLSAALMQLAFRKQLPRFRDNWRYGLEAHAALFLLLIVLLVLSLPGIWLLGFLASVAGLVYASWNVMSGVERSDRVSPGMAARRTTAVGVVYAAALAIVATLLVLGLVGRM